MADDFFIVKDVGATVRWVLQPPTQPITLSALLTKFYDLFHPDDEYPYQPLAWSRDPEEKGERIYRHDDTVVAVYRRGYYITVSKAFRSIYGPHVTRLVLKHPIYKAVEIAGAQLSAFFFADDAMRASLALLIQGQKFYQAPKTQDKIVEI
jgi:hypothetical protein